MICLSTALSSLSWISPSSPPLLHTFKDTEQLQLALLLTFLTQFSKNNQFHCFFFLLITSKKKKNKKQPVKAAHLEKSANVKANYQAEIYVV